MNLLHNYYIRTLIKCLKQSKKYNISNKTSIMEVIKIIEDDSHNIKFMSPHLICRYLLFNFIEDKYINIIIDKLIDDIICFINKNSKKITINEEDYKIKIKNAIRKRQLYHYLSFQFGIDETNLFNLIYTLYYGK